MQQLVFSAGIMLVFIGLWAIVTRTNIIRIIIGFSLLDTGVHVVMTAISYGGGGTAPVINTERLRRSAEQLVTDPVPQALVLTAIVIGLAITALMLLYAVKLHEKKKTLEITSFRDILW